MEKRSNVRRDEFERTTMDVISISPKDMIEVQMPKVQFSNSLSEDSDILQDGKYDSERHNFNTPSLANTWSFDVTVE